MFHSIFSHRSCYRLYNILFQKLALLPRLIQKPLALTPCHQTWSWAGMSLEPSWITTNSTTWSRTTDRLTFKGKAGWRRDYFNLTQNLYWTYFCFAVSSSSCHCTRHSICFSLQLWGDASDRRQQRKGQRERHSGQRKGEEPECQALDRHTDTDWACIKCIALWQEDPLHFTAFISFTSPWI